MLAVALHTPGLFSTLSSCRMDGVVAPQIPPSSAICWGKEGVFLLAPSLMLDGRLNGRDPPSWGVIPLRGAPRKQTRQRAAQTSPESDNSGEGSPHQKCGGASFFHNTKNSGKSSPQREKKTRRPWGRPLVNPPPGGVAEKKSAEHAPDILAYRGEKILTRTASLGKCPPPQKSLRS